MKIIFSNQEIESILIKEKLIPLGYRVCGLSRTNNGFNIYLEKDVKNG